MPAIFGSNSNPSTAFVTTVKYLSQGLIVDLFSCTSAPPTNTKSSAEVIPFFYFFVVGLFYLLISFGSCCWIGDGMIKEFGSVDPLWLIYNGIIRELVRLVPVVGLETEYLVLLIPLVGFERYYQGIGSSGSCCWILRRLSIPVVGLR